MTKPKKPSAVPSNAFWDDEEGAWALGEKEGAKRAGAWTWFRPNGTVLCERKYDEGHLESHRVHETNGDLIDHYFRWDKPYTLKSSMEYRNGQNDRTETFFDKRGKRLYSVRMEQVSKHHERRYEDGQLRFEAIWSQNPKEPPKRVYYDNGQGKALIEYTSLGSGKGTWTLYDDSDRTFSLPEDDEESRNKYGNWSCFIRGFAMYDEKRTQTDVDYARETFLRRHKEHAKPSDSQILAAAAKAKVPEIAGAEKIQWSKLFLKHHAKVAKRFPDWLRALALPNRDANERAAEVLADILECQGAVEEGTAFAVPHLASLLAGKRTPESFRCILFVLEPIADAVAFPEVRDSIIDGTRKAFRDSKKSLEKAEVSAPKLLKKKVTRLKGLLAEMKD